ncbi:TRAP transporter substrate-binding protein [Chloroflexota bacterium]
MKKLLLVLFAVLLVSVLIFAGCTSAPAPAAPPSATPVVTPTTQATPTEKPIVWEFYTPSMALNPSGPTGTLGSPMMSIKDEIPLATKGRLQIKILTGGEHPYKAPDFIKLMKDLHPPMMEFGFAQVAGTDARLSVADLPMLFPPDQDVFYEIADKKLMPEYFDPILLNDYGYQPLITISWTPQRIGGKDFFVNSWDSLKGKKIRTWNAQLVDWVTMMGGSPVSVPLGDVYTSLQTGLLDGIISSSGGLMDNAWGEVCKNLTVIEVQMGLISFMVSKEALDSLPVDVRNDFLAWAKGAQPRARAAYQANVAMQTMAGVAKLGIKIERTPPDFWNEARAQCDQAVWKQFIKRSGGAGSPANEALNQTVEILESMGYKVPYTP